MFPLLEILVVHFIHINPIIMDELLIKADDLKPSKSGTSLVYIHKSYDEFGLENSESGMAFMPIDETKNASDVLAAIIKAKLTFVTGAKVDEGFYRLYRAEVIK